MKACAHVSSLYVIVLFPLSLLSVYLQSREDPSSLVFMTFYKNETFSIYCGSPFPFTSSLRRSHSSCVLEKSTRLISARLCVSCRASPRALLAPLAQAAVRFQTASADRCLPNQSVLLSLISISQASIYFLLASQDQNSAELIINSRSLFHFHFLWRPPPSLGRSHGFQISASSCLWLQGGHWATALPHLSFNSTHFVDKMILLGPKLEHLLHLCP